MIRVILLVAVLLIVPYFFAQSKSVGSFIYLGLPFGFLGVVALHSFVALPAEFFKFLSSFFLVMAMSALRLQVDLKAF